jgi:hypothetical protein
VDRVVKEIIDKYGRNRDEYIKLSFAMAARSRIKESTQIDEKVMGAAYPKGHPMRKFETPASPQTKKLIEGGKAKILKQVTSVLGDTTKFVVIENPTGAWHTGGNQDKVLMATISDPKRGRIKMFAFHGSHISIAKAMQFAINNKLVVTTKMESVEHLDELGLGTLVKYATAAQTQPNRARGFKKALEKINKRKAEIISGTSSLDEESFVFPDEEKAKQFDLDIGNSAIGTGNRVGNTVTVTGITSRWRAAVKKAMLKSKGRFIKDSVKGARQLKNPKTEVMMVDKKGKVIVIDRKDLKSYERKGWIIAESVEHLDENGVEAAHKGSCEEIHPDMPHEHWEKKKKSAYNVPNAMELLKKFNLKGKGRDVPAINNDEWGTPGFTTEGRNRERGDYVVGRRGNFEGEELVVHTDNPNEQHMTVRVPREGGKDRLVRVARTNFNKVSNGYKKRRFPGPKPR